MTCGNVLLFPAMATPQDQCPNRIRELRKARGLTLDALGHAAGISKQHLSKIEVGERELTVAWLQRLARPLGVPPADLLPFDLGGLDAAERKLVQTRREVPEAARLALDAVAESQQPFRALGEVVALPQRKTA